MKKYTLVCKVIASLMLLGEGLFYSFTAPSSRDLIDGAVCGFVFYVIWFMGVSKNVDN